MKKKKMLTCICALMLTAGLIAGDAVPAFAAASAELAADKMQVMEVSLAEEGIGFTEETEAGSNTQTEEEPEAAPVLEAAEEPETAPALEAAEEPETAPVFEEEEEPEIAPVFEEELEKVSASEEKPGTVSVSEEEPGTVPVGQEQEDGRIYVDNALYNGYYIDASEKMYKVTNGAGEPKSGVLAAGTGYYSSKAGKMLTLSKQTLYVNGKTYTGYYRGTGNKMYRVTNGKLTLKTGTLAAGTAYYSYSAKKMQKTSKRRLYVNGKAYTGYYRGVGNKMYRVTKGRLTLKTGTLAAGTAYYSYSAKKIRKMSKRRLYVNGKAYTGYYMGVGKKMYRVKKGALTLATGALAAGTAYYSYSAKKVQTLSNQRLYVNGKAYTGYYLGSDNMMYGASNGTGVLVNTALDAGTPYYSYHARTVLTLPALMVYVNGKAMEGMSAESLVTLQRAQVIVNSITNDSMTKEEKLSICFEFVKNYTEVNPRIPHYKGMDWPIVYANDMFVNGAGNCCSYASALAYMAKAIGYEEVYCCNSGGHGWAEIDGLVYDPEWSMHHHIYSYYALSYDTPTDQAYKGAIAAGLPWMRIKI